jgi:hypothetical protein
MKRKYCVCVANIFDKIKKMFGDNSKSEEKELEKTIII